MQGYSESNVVPLITVRYIGYVEASIQGCTKGSVGTSITVHYIY
jgi:hypothetical protein